MDNVTVLLTGAGAPGIKGTLYSLKNNPDNTRIRTVGVDIRNDVSGKYLCDLFYQIPKPSEKSFIPALLKICKKEKVDVILPQVNEELSAISGHKKDFESIGTKVAISDKKAIDLSNNKNSLLKISRELKLPTPSFNLVNNSDDLEKFLVRLGWPENPVVVKPPVSSGMRGLRIIKERFNRKKNFYSEKPFEIYMRKDELIGILGDSFPELLLMEYLPGKEYSVDLLKTDKMIIVPRSRDTIRTGITFSGTVEKNQRIMKISERLSKKLKLNYVHGFQFKLDENGVPNIIECNPRTQGTMVLSTIAGANVIYGAVKYILTGETPAFDIKWGTRFLRYWGGVGLVNNKIVELL